MNQFADGELKSEFKGFYNSVVIYPMTSTVVKGHVNTDNPTCMKTCDQ